MEMDFITLDQNSFINEMHERFSLDKYHEPSVSHAYSVHGSRFGEPSLNTPPHTALLSPTNFTSNCPLGIFGYPPHEMNFPFGLSHLNVYVKSMPRSQGRPWHLFSNTTPFHFEPRLIFQPWLSNFHSNIIKSSPKHSEILVRVPSLHEQPWYAITLLSDVLIVSHHLPRLHQQPWEAMLIPSNSIQASNSLPWPHVQPWCLFVVRVVCVVCILCCECCESVVQWAGSCSMYGCSWNTTGPNHVFIGDPDNIMVINMGFLVAAHTIGGRGRPSGHVNADYFTGLPQHAAALNIGGWLRAAAASVGDAYFETFDDDMSIRLAALTIGSSVAAASIGVQNFEIFAHNMFMCLATLFIGGDAMAAFFNIDKLNIWNLKFKFKPRTVAAVKRDVLPLLPLSCVWSSEQGPPPALLHALQKLRKIYWVGRPLPLSATEKLTAKRLLAASRVGGVITTQEPIVSPEVELMRKRILADYERDVFSGEARLRQG